MPYDLIIIPAIVVIIAQAIKLATDEIKGNFNLKNLISDYGGMPSSHTAFVISFLTLIGLQTGIASIYFAIALIIAIIVMRDAVGLRQQIGLQGQTLNKIIKKNNLKDYPFFEAVGHRWNEIIVGGLLGLVITLLLYYFL